MATDKCLVFRNRNTPWLVLVCLVLNNCDRKVVNNFRILNSVLPIFLPLFRKIQNPVAVTRVHFLKFSNVFNPVTIDFPSHG